MEQLSLISILGGGRCKHFNTQISIQANGGVCRNDISCLFVFVVNEIFYRK